jgi:hypothetical protein
MNDRSISIVYQAVSFMIAPAVMKCQYGVLKRGEAPFKSYFLLPLAKEGGQGDGFHPGGKEVDFLFAAKELDMLLAHALVLDNFKAGLPGRGGRRGVFNAFLHPHGFSPDFNRLLHDGRDVFRPAEDIDDVYLYRDGREVRVALVAQHGLFVRVDGNYFIAVLFEIAGDDMTGALGIGGKSDNSYRPAVPENIFNRGHRFITLFKNKS